MPESDASKAVSLLRKDQIPVIRKVMFDLTPLAISALVTNMISKDSTFAEKRKCAELILAYGHGRPVNTTVIEEKASSSIIIDQDMANKIEDTFERINKALGKNNGMTPPVQAILEPILAQEGLLNLDDIGNETPSTEGSNGGR